MNLGFIQECLQQRGPDMDRGDSLPQHQADQLGCVSLRVGCRNHEPRSVSQRPEQLPH
jgi:hypothetical protein